MTTDYYKCRCEEESAVEDRLTSLHDDLLISILSFLPIKQRVALSAVCTRFNGLLPSIPRLDTFRLDVERPPGGVIIPQQFTFPRSLIRQCRVVLHEFFCLSKRLEQRLVKGLAESGVQDLILQVSDTGGEYSKYASVRKNCSFFGIKSLRSLSLNCIRASKYPDRLPLLPLGCSLLTSLKMEFSVLDEDFLRNLLASCPFLETLQLIGCTVLTFDYCIGGLSIHSASIKHLILIQLYMLHPTVTIDVRAPQLESLIVDVVTTLRIEAPKVQNASLVFALWPREDPPGTLRKLFRTSIQSGAARLMLNSGETPNILAAENGIDKSVFPLHLMFPMVFKLDFNLNYRSSTTILTELLKNCNSYETKFDIRADSTRIESGTETARNDKKLLHGSTGSELINLQMVMSQRRFAEFLSNKEKMEEFRYRGLKMLRRRTSRKQFKDILASKECLFQISSSIPNCIEMKV